jgi:hypothetical protein
MSAPLRLFLMTRKRGYDWKIFVSQSLEEVHTEWSKQSVLGGVSGVLHVGFGRPAARLFNEVTEGKDGTLLATAGARFVVPSPSKFSETAIEVVDGLPIYVVLDGWGYMIDDPTRTAGLPSEHALGLPSQHDNGSPTTATGWVAQFLDVAPEFQDALEQVYIYDEASYLDREHELPGVVRTALGQFRFDNLVQDSSDALDIVRFSPPWLRTQELEKLPITVRLRNVFNMYGIKRVSDLDNFNREKLFATKNFGRRSYSDLGEALREGLRRGAIDIDFSAGPPSLDQSHPTIGEAPIGGSSQSSIALSIGLIANLLKTLNELEERDREILLGRMGFNEPPRTLESIGSEHGVTRERIRQVEKRSLERIIANELWDDVMRHRLSVLLDNREEPLPLFGLEVVDDWFKGTSDKQDTLSYLIENLCEGRFHVLKVGAVRFVSRIDQETWNTKLREARHLLESAADLNWSEDECQNTVSTFLQDGGTELRPLLWQEASRLCHFSGPSGDRVLTAYGRGLEQMVQVVLEDSPVPLHTSEVAQMVSDVAGKEIGESQIRNAVASVGILLGRGTYGLRKHIPLSDDEIEKIAQLATEVISEHEDDRQWHTSELVAELRERYGDICGDRLDKYNLSVALEMKSGLKYLGRLVWACPDANHAMRVDLRDAVIGILENAGGPLTTSQINDKLTEFRGVNSTFQIWNRDPVIRVGRSLWGLNDRDVVVKRDQQPKLMENVVSAIRRKGTGIHLDEIKDFIGSETDLEPEAIFSIASLDDRISIGVGRFAYLKEWGDSRRVTLKAALDRLANQVPGPMDISDIKDWLEFITERKIEKNIVSHALSSAGMNYLGDGIWEISERDTEAEG